MTIARVIETSVTVNNSPIHDYVHPDNHITRTYDLNSALKAFLTSWKCSLEDIIDVFTVGVGGGGGGGEGGGKFVPQLYKRL